MKSVKKPSLKGKFIVLDGPDGGGKTTQIKLLQEQLIHQGYKVLVTREPGGTAIGEKVRAILLDPAHSEMNLRTELFLYMACRSQLIEEVVIPGLIQDKIVLMDRFLSSTIVYQGYAGDLGWDEVTQIGNFCIDGLWPDLTVILDVDPDVSRLRRAGRTEDRIEQRDHDYQEQVRCGFQLMAKKKPNQVKIVDAQKDVHQVHQDIIQLIKHVL